MNRPAVLMISPAFPGYMQYFTRALAQVGARVIGVGDGAEASLPSAARESLAAYIQVRSYRDEGEVAQRVGEVAASVPLHRIECLWEPYMLLAARLRELLGVPGMTVAETTPFRDKEVMKRVLDRAGIRTPRHASATTVQEVWDAADRIGYPLVVKPIAGAGSESTYRVSSPAELEAVLPRLRAVPEVSVEEFVEGDDYTFDAISVDGEIRYFSMALYRPRALVARENEWISPQTVVLRDVDAPELEPGRRMGEAVLGTLGFRTGFTHMEWYRTPDGEAVFGEIAARPPGAHLVDLMNFASDTDTYLGWAEAAVHGRFTQPVERRYNAAFVFKRARGTGRIRRIEGLEPILSELGPAICVVELNPVGAPRRDWRQTLVGDGMVILRHPDLERCFEMADRVGTRLHLHAE
jgi:formate-dependent phosphoribosylglycinamide formyltransferase (GAR transformylase)